MYCWYFVDLAQPCLVALSCSIPSSMELSNVFINSDMMFLSETCGATVPWDHIICRTRFVTFSVKEWNMIPTMHPTRNNAGNHVAPKRYAEPGLLEMSTVKRGAAGWTMVHAQDQHDMARVQSVTFCNFCGLSLCCFPSFSVPKIVLVAIFLSATTAILTPICRHF